MGTVHQLDNTTSELGRFLDFIYGNSTGIAYSPTKDPQSGKWEQYFFEWPSERTQIISHIERFSPTHEVYYGPALRNSRSSAKGDFKSSECLWVEFDGTLPVELKDVPVPSIKIQSSTEGHEHWYWKLDSVINDSDTLENLTKKLAYTLQADHCWDSSRVLRPPTTVHHESGLTVGLSRWDGRPLGVQEFLGLKDFPTEVFDEDDIREIPDVLKVISKYDWPDDFYNLFMAKEIIKRKSGPGEGRSGALTKVGHYGVELGMSNAEILSLLLHADKRWKKYEGRNDQKKRLISIINRCRAKHAIDPVEEAAVSPFRIYTYTEFMETELRPEWVVEGLIHKKGIVVVGGPSGVGKSTATLRFIEKMAKGERFLKWQPPKAFKIAFVSMEMPHEELYEFLEKMRIQGNPDNMLLMPVGHGLDLADPKVQLAMNRELDRFQPDGVVFDSFGAATDDDINSKQAVTTVTEYAKRVIAKEFGAFSWFIHHFRKEQIGNKKPNKMDDLYGSQYLAASMSTGISLWGKPGDPIEVSCMKLRLAKPFETFYIERTYDNDFKIRETLTGDGPIGMPDLGGLGGMI